MITLKKLRWGNIGSYGEDNELDLDAHTICQLNGKNGAGKTTIAVILSELFTGKNFKNFKKSELSNRKTDEKGYWANCTFETSGKDYLLKLVRTGSKATLSILENGQDVSSHTLAGTYQTLEEILGVDKDTFIKLIYQSSVNSLEFLTTTDAKRKAVLVKLLGLEEYTELGEYSKTLRKDFLRKRRALELEETKLSATLETLEDFDTTPMDLVCVYGKERVEKEEKDLVKLNDAIAKHDKNVRIKKAIKELEGLIEDAENNFPDITIEKPGPFTEEEPEFKEQKELDDLTNRKKVLGRKLQGLETQLKSLKKPENNQCPRCDKILSAEDALDNYNKLKEELETEFESTLYAMDEILEGTLQDLREKKRVYDEKKADWKKRKLSYDSKLKQYYQDKSKLDEKKGALQSLNDQLIKRKEEIDEKAILDMNAFETIYEGIRLAKKFIADDKSNIEHNKRAEAHNAQIAGIKEKEKETGLSLKEVKEKISLIDKDLIAAGLMVKTFSNKGIIGYKIESSVREFERLINKYLTEFSSGRFLLRMRMSGEKLPVTIMDDGQEVGIHTLSQGEMSWVNTSTLLAIRNLLSAINRSKLNFLMLDELTGVLDDDSKEKLVQILLKEQEMNIFTVAHSYEHPLVHQIDVVKEKGISRLVH